MDKNSLYDNLKSELRFSEENWNKLNISNDLFQNPSNQEYWQWLYDFLTEADRKYKKEWILKGFLNEANKWLTEISQKRSNNIANVFLITGNINDYSFSPFKGFLKVWELLSNEFQNKKVSSAIDDKYHIISYNLSSHIRYHNPETNTSSELSDQIKDYKGQYQNPSTNRNQTDIWARVQADFAFFDNLFKANNPKNICLIIQRTEMFFPANSNELHRNFMLDTLLEWADSETLKNNNHTVFLLSESIEDISNYLKSKTSKIETVKIERPDTNERYKFLMSINASSRNEELKQEIRYQKSLPVSGFSEILRLAENTSGLNLIGLEDLLLQSRTENIFNSVNSIKGKLLSEESGGMIELIETDKSFNDIGGLTEVKDRLKEISEAMKIAVSNNLVRKTIPMGILFLGPPGTGKSLMAQAFAKECGLNFIKLGDFRSMWVGETERNLAKTLNLIKTLTPVIVFMDELDQSEGSRGEGGDSGVGKRVFAKLLQFMSDTTLRGKVLWIAASNRPDIIDAALKRAGRFDMSIPFFPPDKEAINDILNIHLKLDDNSSGLNVKLTETERQILIEKLNGEKPQIYYTGAEIELIVNETIRRAVNSNDKTINFEVFQETILNYVPSRENYEQIIFTTLKEVSFTNYLPTEWKELRSEVMKYSNYLQWKQSKN